MRAWRLVLAAAVALAGFLTAVGTASATPAYVQVAGSPFAGGTDTLWSASFSPTGNFFVTGDYFNGEVTMFAVNSATGALTLLGHTATGPGLNPPGPNAVEFGKNSTTTFLGVATDSTVVLFSVSSSGKLTQLGTVQSLPDGPTALDFNSAGTRLAVVTFGGVEMYSVGNAGLAPLGFTPFTGSATSIAFNPTGNLLAVSLQSTDQIRMFSVVSNGSLTSIGSPTPTGSKPDSIAFSPSGKLLAAANQGDDTVSMYSVNSSTGALTPHGTGTPTGAGPSSLDFSPTGRLLAVSNWDGQTLSLFSVNSQTGGLTSVSGSPLPTGLGSFPDAVAFSPTGLIAAPHQTYGISVFAPAPPSAQITSPTTQTAFARGAAVRTRFACADSAFGLGLASCTDTNGSHGPSGHLSTSTFGAHTYSVTARSRDGQSAVARLRYYVANAPSVRITGTRSGKTYKLHAHVATKFFCHEGRGGPGLTTCADSGGAASPRGHLDTSHFGLFHYIVIAISRDGLVGLHSLSFRVAASPSVAITVPRAGRHYARGARVLADFRCHDGRGGSGIKSCHGSARSGRPIDTSASGKHHFTVVARSRDGLRARTTVNYFVG